MTSRVALALVLLCVAVTVRADETFVATLVPQPGTGSAGTGSATLVLNAAQTEISYTITMSGLSGRELAAHIHQPDGAIAHELPLKSPKVGVWQNPGLVNVLYLRSGQLFILIHTEPYPGGELRGDILQQLPVHEATWGAIKAVFTTSTP